MEEGTATMIKNSRKKGKKERNYLRVAEASISSKWQSTDSCWLIQNYEDTISLGKAFIQKIPNLKLVLLQGPLGAGKTSFDIRCGCSERDRTSNFTVSKAATMSMNETFRVK